MWVPAPFTEWAADPRHPYHRTGHPKAMSGAIAFYVDGYECPANDVVVASVTNGYVKYLARDDKGGYIPDSRNGKVRRRMIRRKGPVNIMVRKELTNA